PKLGTASCDAAAGVRLSAGEPLRLADSELSGGANSSELQEHAGVLVHGLLQLWPRRRHGRRRRAQAWFIGGAIECM
ncbi:hypothetical protein, partial [Mycobacterium tuberculosis]